MGLIKYLKECFTLEKIETPEEKKARYEEVLQTDLSNSLEAGCNQYLRLKKAGVQFDFSEAIILKETLSLLDVMDLVLEEEKKTL